MPRRTIPLLPLPFHILIPHTPPLCLPNDHLITSFRIHTLLLLLPPRPRRHRQRRQTLRSQSPRLRPRTLRPPGTDPRRCLRERALLIETRRLHPRGVFRIAAPAATDRDGAELVVRVLAVLEV